MKTALLLLGLILPGWASAVPFVCFTSKPKSVVEYMQPVDVAEVHLAKLHPSCQTLDRISTGLQATSIAFSVGGLYAACTGVGIPATVALEGGALGLQGLDLIVGMLPCEDRVRDAEIKALAEQVVCEELARQGIGCKLRR